MRERTVEKRLQMNQIIEWFKTKYRIYKFHHALDNLKRSSSKLTKARIKRIEIQDGKTPWWF